MTNPLGSGVTRYIDGRDKQLAAVVFQALKPPLDSELNLASLVDLEARAEQVRSAMASGWLLNESNPMMDYATDPNWSNHLYFGRNTAGELRDPTWAIVNGWVIPVSGTRTGEPPLSANNSDTHNKIELNAPNTSTGGSRVESVFLEVWQQRIDVDPASPSIAPGKPQRGYIYRFGNVESGFSYIPDDIVDPQLNYETTKRIQIQYRIRVVAGVNIGQYPEGFDPTLVFAQGALTAPSAIAFQNMREELGDPGLWRAGTGDPTTFGTIDGYVYAVPICAVFRRNGAGFSDTGNLAGAFNRNSAGTTREDATAYVNSIYLPADISETDVQFTLTSISGTVLSTMSSFGEAYFKVDDEIVRVNNINQTGPTSFIISIDRGQLQTVIRGHDSGKELFLYTVRPDGLYADQVAKTDILDLRHSIANKFEYDTTLKTNLINLLRGKLRTTWKRFGSTNPAGPIIIYGDRITDSTAFVGGLSRLDAPDGNRSIFSDAAIVERFSVHIAVPNNSTTIGTELQVQVIPYNISVEWNAAPPTHTAGNRNFGGIPWWWNGDQLKINLDDFYAGLPAIDSDQVRFILPDEDADAVLIHFEGMTTDPNGGNPADQPWGQTTDTAPTVTNPNVATLGNRIMKQGQGIDVSIDGSGNLLITLNAGAVDAEFQEFTDAVPTPPTENLATNTVMHIEFAVLYGAGRGLSHKPDYIHNVHWRGSPTNTSKVMLRPGLSDRNRMIPTYLSDSPYVQTGNKRELARTSQVMIDPGSKTVWMAPYRNMLVPPLLVRDGSTLNWTNSTTFQGAMPTQNQEGTTTVHTTVDPLNLFYVGVQTRYAEIPLKFLPRPGLHHVPIISTTDSVFPSGINWLLMSKEGPFGGINSSDWNRNLVSYPSTAGYYIVTPETGETYGTGSLPSVFGQKYTNTNLHSANGGSFKGIQFPPFYGPARITGIYLRDTSGPAPHPTTPASTPFSTDRVYIGGSGTDTNLLKDDFDGPSFLLLVDENGDMTFVLNADVMDLTKAPSGTTFDNSEFIVECTLFGFDRGFLQTNGRILIARTSGGGSLPINIDAFTDTTDDKIGIIAPAPMTLNSTNNEATIYYSRQPYQGDVFGSQDAYSDDTQKKGPLSISEAESIRVNPLGSINTLSLNNKKGYEVLAAVSFITSLGSGRISGSNPIPILSPESNPNSVVDYAGTLIDLNRRFSSNRVGYEDWSTPKFPVIESAFASRPPLNWGAISEVFDRDVNLEFSGCTAQLPLGIYFRDKDFSGKTLYQIRSASDVGVAAIGTTIFPPYQAPVNPVAPGVSTWEGVEYVTGQASGTSGVGGEVIITVDGTHSYSSITNFKTTRGGAGWSGSGPWPGGPLASRMPKARPNSEVGSVLAGTAYLVRSQPEWVNSIEVHHGQELQMIIVTRAVPAYFRNTDVLHSASGTNEGFTAVDRFRIWGRPLEKRRAEISVGTSLPEEEPLFVNEIFDDPIFYGSSDISLSSNKQETLPILSDGQTLFTLSERPVDPTTVMAFARGVKLTYGTDYTVGGVTNQTLTYIVHAANPSLLTTDTLEIWYVVL